MKKLRLLYIISILGLLLQQTASALTFDQIKQGQTQPQVLGASTLDSGAYWTQLTAAAPWQPRVNFGTAVVNGTVYVIGGTAGATIYNDVWSSTDGVNWTQKAAGLPWAPRSYFATAVLNNVIYIMGGRDGSNVYYHDVWSSTDGVNWTQLTSAAAWPARYAFGVVAYNNHLWAMGGVGASGYLNDVWSSPDGITWTKTIAAAAWSPRQYFGLTVFNNQMFVLDGYRAGVGYNNDVWSSSDGITWSQLTASASWSARGWSGVLVYGGLLWLLGGGNAANAYLQDVWSTSDGTTWTQTAMSSPTWSGRNGLGAAVLGSHMIVLGGGNGSVGALHDVWQSIAAPLAPPAITSFTANPTSVTPGQSTTLSWVTSNATSLSIDNSVGSVSGTSVTVTPSVSTTYTLTASNGTGTVTAKAVVNVNTGAPPVIANVQSSAVTVSGATVTWTTDSPSDSQVEYGPTTAYGSLSALNSSLVTSHSAALSGLSGATTYHYRVKSRDSSGNLAVSADAAFTTSAAAIGAVPRITSFSATPASVTTGQPVTLSWVISSLYPPATSITIDNGIGSQTALASGTVAVYPTVTTTYVLTATNAAGSSQASVSVTVGTLAGLAVDRINAAHPRWMVNADIINHIHSQVTNNTPEWQQFKAAADTLYSYGLLNRDGGNAATTWMQTGAAMYLALHGLPNEGASYDVHNATEWGQMVIKWANNSMNYDIGIYCTGGVITGCSDTKGTLSGTDLLNAIPQFAAVYDWVNGEMTQQQKQDLYTFMRYATHAKINDTSAAGWVSWCKPIGTYAGPDDNECAGLQQAVLETGIVTYGDGVNPTDDHDQYGNPATGTNYEFDFALNSPYGFRSLMTSWFNSGYGVGGAPDESTEYTAGDITYHMRTITALLTGTNVNPLNEMPNYLSDTINWMTYNITPAPDSLTINGNIYYMYQWNDLQGNELYRNVESYRIGGLVASYLAGSSLSGQMMRYFLDNYYSLWTSGSATLNRWYELFYQDYPDAVQTNPAAVLAPDYNSNARCTVTDGTCGMNWTVSRSAWSSSATVVTERAGDTRVRHGHFDAGNFTLYRKGRWLILNTPGYGGPWNSSDLHSVLQYQGVNDHNSSGTFVWKGGQQATGNGPGRQLNYEDVSSKYVYINSDITQDYRSSAGSALTYGDWLNPNLIQRELVYLKPDYVVVLDRGLFRDLTATRFITSLVTTSGTTGAPVYSNGVITSRNLDQLTCITPIAPAGTNVNLTDLTNVTSVLEGARMDTVTPGQLNSGAGQTFWRAEITTPAQANSQVMLNAIQGADVGSTPTPAVAVNGSGIVGTHLKDPITDQIAIFSSSPSGAKITFPITYTITPQAATRNHLIVDLPVNTAVKVASVKNGSQVTYTVSSSGTGTAYTTSNQGTLSFSDTDSSFIPPTDTTLPTISSFSATPNPITLGSTATLSWSVSGATSVSLDNSIGDVTALTSKSVSPATTTTYTLTATNSNGSVTSTVTVVVNNAPDTTNPTASITTPSSGSTVSGTITVSASASDPTVSGQVTSGLNLVTLSIDGSVFSTSTTGTLSKSLDTTTLTNGSHTLAVTAKDNAGNVSSASSETVTVNNVAATKYPRLVTLTSLEGLSSIPSNTTITATVLSSANGSIIETESNLTPTAGQYTVSFQASDPQLVNIRIQVNGYLSQLLTNIDTTVNSSQALSVPQLLAGDLNNDNTINSLDYSLMNSHFLQNFSSADINKDSLVNSLDFAILKNNYGKSGQ